MTVRSFGVGEALEHPLQRLVDDATAIALPFIDVTDVTYSATGDGVSDDRAAIAAADIAAVAAGATLVIPAGTYLVSSDLTLTAPLIFMGGILKPARGVTIHINGPMTAPLEQCFDLNLSAITGTVTVTKDSMALAGVGTNFDGELVVGGLVKVGEFYGTVASITNDTNAVLASVWAGPTAAGATMHSGGLIMFGSAANQWDNTYVRTAHPEWWGVNGNTTPYDTAAVQSAINSHIPVEFSRSYYVTTVNLTGNELVIKSRQYQLVGVSATASTDAILQIQCGYSDLDLHVDGNFSTNYKCGVRIFGDASHTNPQFNTIDRLWIENVLVGLVLGSHVTYVNNTSAYTVDTPYDCPLSETVIGNFRTWSVERGVTMNQPNGKVQLNQPTIVATKGNWTGDGVSTGSYRYNRSYVILNVPAASGPTVGGGELCVFGGSIVANDTTTQLGIRGANIQTHASIWEVHGKLGIIEGDRVIVTDQLNGSGKEGFEIAATAPVGGAAVTGQLRLVNCTFNRSTDADIFVDCAATTFTTVLTDTEVRGWLWSHTSQLSGLVRGCKAYIKGLRFRSADGTTTDIRVEDNTAPSIFTTADPVGNSLSGVVDLAAKGGWAPGGGGAGTGFAGTTATAPTGLAGSLKLVAANPGNSVTADSTTGTNGFRVAAGTTRILEAFVQAAGDGNVIIDVFWYNYSGAASATASTRVFLGNPASLSLAAFKRVLQYVTVPSDAAFASIRLYADANTVATTAYFSGIRF
jgi:hypothetical protein